MASTLTINVEGIPDGDYETVFVLPGDTVYRETLTYASGSTLATFSVVAGDVRLKGFVDDNEIISLNAAYLEGVTVLVPSTGIGELYNTKELYNTLELHA